MASLTSWELDHLALSTEAAGISVALCAFTVALVNTRPLLADPTLNGSATSADGGSVSKVAVDTDEVRGYAIHADVLNNDVTRALRRIVGAVAAGPVELSGVDGSEAANSNGTNIVVLDDLVLGSAGTATSDNGIAATDNGDRIFADVTEPDVPQSAGSLTVNTLECVGTDNDVRERSTVCEDEDGVFIAGVSISVAGPATVELLVAHVHSASDRAGTGERDDVARTSRDRKSLGRCHASGKSEEDDLRDHFDDG